jgi:hypothetical protein
MKFIKLTFTLSFLASFAQGVVSTAIQPRARVPGADTPEFYLVSSSQTSQANLLVRRPFLSPSKLENLNIFFKSAFAGKRRLKWLYSAHRLRAHWRVLLLSRQTRGCFGQQPQSFFARINCGNSNVRMHHIRPARFCWFDVGQMFPTRYFRDPIEYRKFTTRSEVGL